MGGAAKGSVGPASFESPMQGNAAGGADKRQLTGHSDISRLRENEADTIVLRHRSSRETGIEGIDREVRRLSYA